MAKREEKKEIKHEGAGKDHEKTAIPPFPHVEGDAHTYKGEVTPGTQQKDNDPGY